jgi:quercetin dioxygenase-like cupin family protein
VAVYVLKNFFQDRGDILEDLKVSGFWPSTYVSGASPGLPVHWHSHAVHAYVVEGRTTLHDAEKDFVHQVGPGDKIVVEPRTLHAEGEVKDRVVYIIAAPEALPPDEFLKRRPPEERDA